MFEIRPVSPTDQQTYNKLYEYSYGQLTGNHAHITASEISVISGHISHIIPRHLGEEWRRNTDDDDKKTMKNYRRIMEPVDLLGYVSADKLKEVLALCIPLNGRNMPLCEAVDEIAPPYNPKSAAQQRIQGLTELRAILTYASAEAIRWHLGYAFKEIVHFAVADPNSRIRRTAISALPLLVERTLDVESFDKANPEKYEGKSPYPSATDVLQRTVKTVGARFCGQGIRLAGLDNLICCLEPSSQARGETVRAFSRISGLFVPQNADFAASLFKNEMVCNKIKDGLAKVFRIYTAHPKPDALTLKAAQQGLRNLGLTPK